MSKHRTRSKRPRAKPSPASATLEELEGATWKKPQLDTCLTSTVMRLRRVPVAALGVEDLRILIGQGIGLRHVLPRALKLLEADPLSKGDFYPGDLLVATLGLAELLTTVQLKRVRSIAEAALKGESRRLIPELRGDIEAFIESGNRP